MMAAYYEETLEDRYSRENQDYLSVLARMKPEQIQHMEISLNNALSDADMLRRDVKGLVEALEGLLGVIGESRGVSGYHLNGEIAEWDEFQEVYDATAALAAYRKGGE